MKRFTYLGFHLTEVLSAILLFLGSVSENGTESERNEVGGK